MVKKNNLISRRIENNLTSEMITDAILGKVDKKKSYLLKTKGRETEYLFNEDISKKTKEEIETLIKDNKFQSIRRDIVKI